VQHLSKLVPGQILEAAAKIQSLKYYTFYFLSEFLELYQRVASYVLQEHKVAAHISYSRPGVEQR
jgi:hypothetical protein